MRQMGKIEQLFILNSNNNNSSKSSSSVALFKIVVNVRSPNSDISLGSTTFVDSGASFNGVSSDLVSKLGLEIMEYPDRPLQITLGANTSSTIPRRIVQVVILVEGFDPYPLFCFVLPLPPSCDLLLGLPWLKAVNPVINWNQGTVNSRGFSIPVEIIPPADTSGRIVKSDSVEALQYIQHMNHLYHLTLSNTRIFGSTTKAIAYEDLAMELRDNVEFCFVVLPTDLSEKEERLRTTDWSSFESNPAYPLIRKYQDIFRTTLPIQEPNFGTRRKEIVHEIDLTNETPIAVKQYPMSPAERAALIKWTTEMESMGVIRRSKSPYNFPIFAVKKPDGFRFVHDYRVLNAKTLMPQQPIPLKEEIIQAMHLWQYNT